MQTTNQNERVLLSGADGIIDVRITHPETASRDTFSYHTAGGEVSSSPRLQAIQEVVTSCAFMTKQGTTSHYLEEFNVNEATEFVRITDSSEGKTRVKTITLHLKHIHSSIQAIAVLVLCNSSIKQQQIEGSLIAAKTRELRKFTLSLQELQSAAGPAASAALLTAGTPLNRSFLSGNQLPVALLGVFWRASSDDTEGSSIANSWYFQYFGKPLPSFSFKQTLPLLKEQINEFIPGVFLASVDDPISWQQKRKSIKAAKRALAMSINLSHFHSLSSIRFQVMWGQHSKPDKHSSKGFTKRSHLRDDSLILTPELLSELSTTEEYGGVDLDTSCVLFDADGQFVEAVYFGQPTDSNGCIRHEKMNMMNYDEDQDFDGDSEFIEASLRALPERVCNIFFAVTIYSGQYFTDVSNPTVRVLDGENNSELVRFSLLPRISIPGNRKLSASSSMVGEDGIDSSAFIACSVFRNHDGTWSLLPLGEHAPGKVFRDLITKMQDMIVSSERAQNDQQDYNNILTSRLRKIQEQNATPPPQTQTQTPPENATVAKLKRFDTGLPSLLGTTVSVEKLTRDDDDDEDEVFKVTIPKRSTIHIVPGDGSTEIERFLAQLRLQKDTGDDTDSQSHDAPPIRSQPPAAAAGASSTHTVSFATQHHDDDRSLDAMHPSSVSSPYGSPERYNLANRSPSAAAMLQTKSAPNVVAVSSQQAAALSSPSPKKKRFSLLSPSSRHTTDAFNVSSPDMTPRSAGNSPASDKRKFSLRRKSASHKQKASDDSVLTDKKSKKKICKQM